MRKQYKFIRILPETKIFIDNLKKDLVTLERNPRLSDNEILRRISRIPNLTKVLKEDSLFIKRRRFNKV